MALGAKNGEVVTLSAEGDGADAALDSLVALLEARSGRRMSELHATLSGIGVSAGVAVGPLVIVSPPPTAPSDEAPTTDAAAASQQVRDTLKAVADGLTAEAAKADAHAKPILRAGAMMAGDPGLAGAIDTQLQSGKGITNAVSAAIDEYCAMFESLGGYMAEQVADLRDVRDRTVARLLGQPEPGFRRSPNRVCSRQSTWPRQKPRRCRSKPA